MGSIHRKRKFLGQLKGSYIDYENFFRTILYNIESVRCVTHDAASGRIMNQYLPYTQYLDTDTDIDWKHVCLRFLFELGDSGLPWYEGSWCVKTELTGDPNGRPKPHITKDEYRVISGEFRKWMDHKLKSEKLFMPIWYERRLTHWQALGWME